MISASVSLARTPDGMTTSVSCERPMHVDVPAQMPIPLRAEFVLALEGSVGTVRAPEFTGHALRDAFWASASTEVRRHRVWVRLSEGPDGCFKTLLRNP